MTTALVTVGALALTGGVTRTAAATPSPYQVTQVVGGLSIPWDLTWVGPVMLYDQRAGGIWSKRENGTPQRVTMALPRIYAHSESGMLGIVADPNAATNKHFYTCFAVATSKGKAQDVQVWKWRLTSDTTAVKVKKLIDGIPLTSGRHSGCRLRFRSSTMLYVGTGDAVVGTNPQSKRSLGGKILRVHSDGSIPKSNPYASRRGKARYIWTYGHRNVQGLAYRAQYGQMWSVEHGTGRDDEINLVLKKGNYGWSPTPGYNERRAMTDQKRYPKARSAKWRSGKPTVATSGATFVNGPLWGGEKLAVAMLKGQGIKLFTVTAAGKITSQRTILTNYGRIRTVQTGPDGSLYFTTSNGSGNDGIYLVTPGGNGCDC